MTFRPTNVPTSPPANPSNVQCQITQGSLLPICIGAGGDASDYACFETKLFLPYTVSSGCVSPISVAFNSCVLETRDTIDEEIRVEKMIALESSLIGMGDVHIEEVDGEYIAFRESSGYIELTLAPAKEAAAAVTPANEAMTAAPPHAGVRGHRRRDIKPNPASSRLLKQRRERTTKAPTSPKNPKTKAPKSPKNPKTKAPTSAKNAKSTKKSNKKGGSSVKNAKNKSVKTPSSGQASSNSTSGVGVVAGGNNNSSGVGVVSNSSNVSNSTLRGFGRSLTFTLDDCSDTCLEINGGIIDDDGVGNDEEFVCIRAQAIDGVVRIAYTVRDGNGVSASFSIPVTVRDSSVCIPPLSTCENPALDPFTVATSRPTVSPTSRPTVPPSAAPFTVAVINSSGQAATGNRGRRPRE
jgi:hypothetical protein